ncbi:FadR family transcriptional regulator [Amycolatopsis rubida]|uniref:FadR family transcriptional regulator n=1 Tax=Amycolatopsis rubida TaxID=112413 RepID=A0ABX0BRQ8_9PSEU|nr:FadR/GntR family transcriptional regulator [Amycolatopsis sp. M39]NEC56787.1 FadR family transcriptional regulator [Amycolatopsis rubida]OAP21729.1 putative L-lactate dehydrogenase operon regulatory protein [Amycolatopsis sp. M39]
MPLATTRRAGLVDQVIDQLREAVTAGEWPIGHRIPTEPELSAQLGVGRNTVREAVRALAHTGILEVRQGDGTYVRATSEVSGAIRRLCGTELREVLHVRRLLEVEGARLAATARTEEDLAELRVLLNRRDTDWDEGRLDDFARSDAEFHQVVVRCGHNGLLLELYRGLMEAITASVASTSDNPEHAEMIRHRELVDAIETRDAGRAADEAAGFLDELIARAQGW